MNKSVNEVTPKVISRILPNGDDRKNVPGR